MAGGSVKWSCDYSVAYHRRHPSCIYQHPLKMHIAAESNWCCDRKMSIWHDSDRVQTTKYNRISFLSISYKMLVWLCLGQGADLHMAQLMPLPLTISCSSKSRLVLRLPFWCQLTRGSPGQNPRRPYVCVTDIQHSQWQASINEAEQQWTIVIFCGRFTQCYHRREDAGPCSPWHARCMTYQLPHSHAVLVSLVGRYHRGAHAPQSSRRHPHCRQLPLSKHLMQLPTHCHQSGINVVAWRQCRQNTSMTVEICWARRVDLAEGCALISCHTCQIQQFTRPVHSCPGSMD